MVHNPPRQTMLEEALALVERPAYMRSALAAADVVVSPSRFLAGVLESNGVDPRRIVVSPNGVAKRPRAMASKPRAPRLRLALIGTLLPYKGAHVALEAIRLLPGDRIELHVYGDLDQPATVHRYAATLLPLAEGQPVAFHGRFSPDEVWSILRHSDVVIVPSLWYENAPMTILEAFASRTPVIASALGGMAELIQDGVNGLLFEPGNPADLALCVNRLLEDPDEIERLASAAPKVKDADECASDYEALYRCAIDHKRHSAIVETVQV